MSHSENATLMDGIDTRRITVCRGKSGRLYADAAMAVHDCEADSLNPTDEPNVFEHPHTGYIVEIDEDSPILQRATTEPSDPMQCGYVTIETAQYLMGAAAVAGGFIAVDFRVGDDQDLIPAVLPEWMSENFHSRTTPSKLRAELIEANENTYQGDDQWGGDISGLLDRIPTSEADGEGRIVHNMTALDPHNFWLSVTDVPCPKCSGTIRWFEAGYVPGYRICDGCEVHFQAGGTAANPTLQELARGGMDA